jgi:hypothetical protein
MLVTTSNNQNSSAVLQLQCFAGEGTLTKEQVGICQPMPAEVHQETLSPQP